MNEELLIGSFPVQSSVSNTPNPTPPSPATPLPLPAIRPTSANSSPAPNSGAQRPITYKRLSPIDLQAIRLAIGASTPSKPSSLIHSTNILWPPSSIPRGLYHDILRSLTIAKYKYHFLAFIFNTLLILQLLLGASLTALSSTSSSHSSDTSIVCAAATTSFSSLTLKSSIIITTLAAVNTVVAGLIALLHNGGLPSKYRVAWKEFEKVDMQVSEILEAGLVREESGVDEVVESCFEAFWEARRKVDGVNANGGKSGVGEGFV